MFGANGSATVNNSLLQLRALDWNVDGQLLISTNTVLKSGPIIFS